MVKNHGFGAQASRRQRCPIAECDGEWSFIGRVVNDREVCHHLNTPYMDQWFNLLHWTATIDERLQTEKRRCAQCKAMQPVGRMNVYEDKESAAQSIYWQCFDDRVACVDRVIQRRRNA